MTPGDYMSYSIYRYALLALAGLNAVLSANASEPISTNTHRFTEIRDNIWLAQTTEAVFNSNALVIINEDDVVLIDSHVTPNKARQLIESIKVLTNNPITTLINSHHHWDHAHGNQVFADIPIIGHEFTYMRLATTPLDEPTYVRGLEGNASGLIRIQGQIDTEQDAEKKKDLQEYLAIFAAHVKDFDEIDPIPPTITLNDRMTLFRGDREMQIIFLGRAHTGGDLAVYFPDSKVVFTGDMAFAGPSFLGDGYVDEWPQTLRNLMELDFDIFVPGHGGPVTDLSRLELVAQYYEDLWVKAEALHHDGVPYDQAAKTIDLTNHTSIPIRNVGADPLAIQRIYYRLENPD